MLVARDDNHKNLFLFLVFHVDIIDDAINLFGSHGFKWLQMFHRVQKV